MVSPKMIRDLKRCYEAVLAESLDPHKYSGSLFDVVFQIISAETLVAGVASKILDRETVTPKEIGAISRPLLLENNQLLCDDGQTFDIEPFPEIRRVATSIETLCAKCYEALSFQDNALIQRE